jgi:hypothetical protein
LAPWHLAHLSAWIPLLAGRDSGLEGIGFWRVRSLSGTLFRQSLTARTVEVRKDAMRMILKDLNGSPVWALFVDDLEKFLCPNLEHQGMNELSFIGDAGVMFFE